VLGFDFGVVKTVGSACLRLRRHMIETAADFSRR
jgi:hypothetical protein